MERALSSTSPCFDGLLWGAVDCIHRNRDITGYSVQYGVQGSGNMQLQSVSIRDITEVTILKVRPSTTYIIEVAAVNSAGTGVYSDGLSVVTSGELFERHNI